MKLIGLWIIFILVYGMFSMKSQATACCNNHSDRVPGKMRMHPSMNDAAT